MFTLKCAVKGMEPYTKHFKTYEQMTNAITLRQALKIQGAYACLETGEIWCTTNERGELGKEEWVL